MGKNKNGLLLIVAAILALVVVVVLAKGNYISPQTANGSIQNAADLNAKSKELDGENLNKIDEETTKLNSDSSGF